MDIGDGTSQSSIPKSWRSKCHISFRRPSVLYSVSRDMLAPSARSITSQYSSSLRSLEASLKSTTAGAQMQVPASTRSPHLPQSPTLNYPYKNTHDAGIVHDITGQAQEEERRLRPHNIPGLDSDVYCSFPLTAASSRLPVLLQFPNSLYALMTNSPG